MFKGKVEINRFILILLCISAMAEICFFFYQWNYLNEKLVSMQTALGQSEGERIQVTKVKNGLLIEKEKLIAEKNSLNAEMNDLNAKIGQLNDLLGQANVDKKSMQSEIDKLTKESLGLKEQMRLLEGKIGDLSEVDQVVESKHRAIAEMRKRARELKTKAQRELDHFRSEAGNHGFVVKENKSTLIYEKLIQFEQRIRNIDLKKIIVKPAE